MIRIKNWGSYKAGDLIHVEINPQFAKVNPVTNFIGEYEKFLSLKGTLTIKKFDKSCFIFDGHIFSLLGTGSKDYIVPEFFIIDGELEIE